MEPGRGTSGLRSGAKNQGNSLDTGDDGATSLGYGPGYGR